MKFLEKKIMFTANGTYVPGVGRVYYGKELLLPTKKAAHLVNSGYAEFVVEKTPDVSVESDEKVTEDNKGKKDGKSRKSKANKEPAKD